MLDDGGVDRALEALVVVAVLALGAAGVGNGVARGALASSCCPGELLLHGLVLRWQEDNLGVCRLGHLLHRLEVPDLHGRRAAQDIGGLPHQLGGFDLGAGRNDLGLTGTLALRGHGQRVLQLLAEDDVLDEHTLDLDAPAGRDLLDNVADVLCDLFAALDDVLQDARADDVAERRLGSLDERLPDVADAEGGAVRRHDAVVDDGGEPQGDVILCHADLLGHLDELNLDVDLDEALRERVDLDETWVDCAREAAELGDEANVALIDGLVRVRADDAAWNRAASTDAVAQGVDHAAVPAVGARILRLCDDDLRVRGLQVLRLRRLDCD